MASVNSIHSLSIASSRVLHATSSGVPSCTSSLVHGPFGSSGAWASQQQFSHVGVLAGGDDLSAGRTLPSLRVRAGPWWTFSPKEKIHKEPLGSLKEALIVEKAALYFTPPSKQNEKVNEMSHGEEKGVLPLTSLPTFQEREDKHSFHGKVITGEIQSRHSDLGNDEGLVKGELREQRADSSKVGVGEGVDENDVASKLSILEGRREDGLEKGEGKAAVRVATFCVQGRREEMEDEMMVQQDVGHGFAFAAVFDGHAGNGSSYFLKNELLEVCIRHLDGGLTLAEGSEEDVASALEDAFRDVDYTLLQRSEELSDDSGSTATVVFARKDKIIAANVGDSRAVVSWRGNLTELTADHRPHGDSQIARSEVQRVKEAGGWVSSGRVCGAVAVSRAFGNLRYKNGREEMLLNGISRGRWTKRFVSKLKWEEDWISASPHVFVFEPRLEETKEDGSRNLLIVASDGLWDFVRSSEAVRLVERELLEHNDLERACSALGDFALNERKGDDNISLAIFEFGDFPNS